MFTAISNRSASSTPLQVRDKKDFKDPRSLEKHALEAIMMMKADDSKIPRNNISERTISTPTIKSGSVSAIYRPPVIQCPPKQVIPQAEPKFAFRALIEAAKNDKRKKVRAALGLRAGPWTKQEDKMLRKAVDQVNSSDNRPQFFWTKVAESVPYRDNEQCRNRWRYHVNPEINSDPFTPEEFRFFLEFQRKNGNRWTELGRQLKGRSRTFIANEWQHAKRTLSSFLATRRNVPESSTITKDGKIDYQDDFEACLQELITKRERKVVREKFLNNSGNDTSDTESVSDSDSASLSSPEIETIDKTRGSSQPHWTYQEDHVLMTMAAQLGHFPGKWSTIADRFSRRSAKDCRDRWESQKGRLHSQGPKISKEMPASLQSENKENHNSMPSKRHASWPVPRQCDYPGHGHPNMTKRARSDATCLWRAPSARHQHFYTGSHHHQQLPPAYPGITSRVSRVPVPRRLDPGSNVPVHNNFRQVSMAPAVVPVVVANRQLKDPVVSAKDSKPTKSSTEGFDFGETNAIRKDSQSWTKEEDEKLRHGMEQHKDLGQECMARIAQDIPGRDAKQCHQRWVCQVQPGLNKDPLTPEQIRELLVLQKTWGNRWTSIGKALGGKNGGYSKSFVSNRWFHRIRPTLFRYLSDKHGVPYSEIQSRDGVIQYGDDFEGAVKAVIQEVLFNGRRYQNPGRL